MWFMLMDGWHGCMDGCILALGLHLLFLKVETFSWDHHVSHVSCTLHPRNCLVCHPSVRSGGLKSRHHWLVQPLPHRKLPPLIQQTIPKGWSLGCDGRERTDFMYSDIQCIYMICTYFYVYMYIIRPYFFISWVINTLNTIKTDEKLEKIA